ncbi:MAG: hypothetical protein WC451_06160 [Patescibacteria group bacterium]|jgi:hypothetical protein
MWRKLLIKIFFKLLKNDETYHGINDKKIDDWLVRQYGDMGFREYFRKRDLQILKTIGIGLSADNYQLSIGQRLEVLLLLQRVDQAWKKEDKRLKKLKQELKSRK